MATRFLTLEDVLTIARALGAGPVRDIGLIESAAARPQSTIFGADAYPTTPLKAAALLHSLVRNHALVDGNKPTGWLSFTVFLALNGVAVNMDHDAAYYLVLDVAQDKLSLAEIVAACHLD